MSAREHRFMGIVSNGDLNSLSSLLNITQLHGISVGRLVIISKNELENVNTGDAVVELIGFAKVYALFS